jgi:protein-L-isoaspartate(D-aspartate) O-methyltransferase
MMDPASAQQRLIEKLTKHGITDRRVLEAVAAVPRHRFVRAEYQELAYEDRALSIEAGQTISQPYMVALMTQELRLTGPETILEVGTGSGYQAAILARLVNRVVTVERIASLAAQARRTLAELGIMNVECHVADGSSGWPAAAPYDGIVVTAGAPRIPEALYLQLRTGGRLVIPVSRGQAEMLQTVVRTQQGPVVADVCECSFVPLIGEGGWAEAPDGMPDE